MVWKISSAVSAVCMAALAVMSQVVGYCGGVLECGTSTVPMHCYYAYQAVLVIAIVGLVMACVGLFMKGAEARRVSAIAVILVAIAIAVVLFAAIGVCGKAEMSCNANRIFFMVVAAVGVVAAIAGIVKADDQAADRPKAKL